MSIADIQGVGVYRSEIFYSEPSELTPSRIVDMYEIELFYENYEYGLLNGEIIEYKKNTVLIAHPGDVRQSKPHFCCYYVHVDVTDEYICERLNSLPRSFLITDEAKYTKIFKSIASAFPEGNKTDELFSTGWLLILISELIKDSSDIYEKIISAPKIQQNSLLSAKAFMNHNYKFDIKLKDIADSVHLSPNYFHKLFKSTYGISPLEYLTNERIKKARLELLCSEKTITAISSDCGFSSYSYFCTVFKKNCGVTPSDFRKRNSLNYSI